MCNIYIYLFIYQPYIYKSNISANETPRRYSHWWMQLQRQRVGVHWPWRPVRNHQKHFTNPFNEILQSYNHRMYFYHLGSCITPQKSYWGWYVQKQDIIKIKKINVVKDALKPSRWNLANVLRGGVTGWPDIKKELRKMAIMTKKYDPINLTDIMSSWQKNKIQ